MKGDKISAKAAGKKAAAAVCAVLAAGLLVALTAGVLGPDEGDETGNLTTAPAGSYDGTAPGGASSGGVSSGGTSSGGTNSTGGAGSDEGPDYSYLGLGAKFYDRFNLDGSVTVTDNSYVSGRVSITLTEIEYEGAVCHVADVYVCDIENYGTVFAKDRYGISWSNKEPTPDMAERSGAILAVNGDYYAGRSGSFLVRNGVLYDDSDADDDVCVLYADGTMETYYEDEFDPQTVIDRGPWQVWDFGPKLMDNGEKMPEDFEFNSSVNPRNPRTAIGYYEPGHYCIVAVDGRNGVSRGLTLHQLSAFFADELGCTDAFNLDGGQTSVMYFNGRVVNDPYKGGRECSDIIGITDK